MYMIAKRGLLGLSVFMNAKTDDVSPFITRSQRVLFLSVQIHPPKSDCEALRNQIAKMFSPTTLFSKEILVLPPVWQNLGTVWLLETFSSFNILNSSSYKRLPTEYVVLRKVEEEHQKWNA